jgi:two-component system, chemotaxis family, response regulator Rcp1
MTNVQSTPALLSYEDTGHFLAAQRGILIIEDNPGDVRLMREALRDVEPPVTIHVAHDGEHAFRLLRGEEQSGGPLQPSLIFLDFNLPKSDSRDILRQIKEHPRLRVIPIAVLTTSDSERDIRDAYELYANCYLKKPGNLDDFLNTIRSAAHFWLNVASLSRDLA